MMRLRKSRQMRGCSDGVVANRLAVRLLRALEVPLLVAVPVALAAAALFQFDQSALFTFAVAFVAVGVLFAGFEKSRPALRQIMPAAVLGALAAAGRILFAPIPDFKPVSAICILAGAVFGRRSGFMVGALAALVSNFFFGQGPWTPWQMYAWGLVGYLAGVLADVGAFGKAEGESSVATPLPAAVPPASAVPSSAVPSAAASFASPSSAASSGPSAAAAPSSAAVPPVSAVPPPAAVTSAAPLPAAASSVPPVAIRPARAVFASRGRSGLAGRAFLYVYGFLSALLYGFLLNGWTLVGFVHPITWQSALAVYGAGLPFDLLHGAATVVFLAVLYEPWSRKLDRIKRKYALADSGGAAN